MLQEFDATKLDYHLRVIKEHGSSTEPKARWIAGKALEMAHNEHRIHMVPFDDFIRRTDLSAGAVKELRAAYLASPDEFRVLAAPLTDAEVRKISRECGTEPRPKRETHKAISNKDVICLTRENEKLRLVVEFLAGRPMKGDESSRVLIDECLRHIEGPYQELLSTPTDKLRGFPSVHDFFVTLREKFRNVSSVPMGGSTSQLTRRNSAHAPQHSCHASG